jgi:hypothetical protein
MRAALNLAAWMVVSVVVIVFVVIPAALIGFAALVLAVVCAWVAFMCMLLGQHATGFLVWLNPSRGKKNG